MTEPTPIGVAAHRWAERVGHPSASPAAGPPADDAGSLGEAAESDLGEWRRRQVRERWAQIPRRFREAHVSDFDGSVGKALTEWTEDIGSGSSLVLLGPVGTGKTHAAFAALRARMWAVVDAARDPLAVGALSVPMLLDKLRPGGDQHEVIRPTVQSMAALDLLLLDDLGAERTTEWAEEVLAALIDQRWLELRPLIVTTNAATRAELVERYGERLVSRLLDGSTVVRLTGEDRRR